MKYFETRFEDYIKVNEKTNIHPSLQNLYKLFPDELGDLKHMIFYGPAGVGKYTQVLSSIKKYSPTHLKYQRKINITYQKKHEYNVYHQNALNDCDLVCKKIVGIHL